MALKYFDGDWRLQLRFLKFYSSIVYIQTDIKSKHIIILKITRLQHNSLVVKHITDWSINSWKQPDYCYIL